MFDNALAVYPSASGISSATFLYSFMYALYENLTPYWPTMFTCVLNATTYSTTCTRLAFFPRYQTLCVYRLHSSAYAIRLKLLLLSCEANINHRLIASLDLMSSYVMLYVYPVPVQSRSMALC